MTTKELYIKHKSGEVSNQKFLYEVRRDARLPWITNMTSYEDAVKILKNKGIINEADAKKYGDVEVISKTIDMVNPYEYSKGMNYELDMSMNPVRQDLDEEEVLAAQKIVLKNITKDANYYTKLYAGLNPTAEVEGYKEIDIAGKNLEKGIKADMQGRKADGYIKKELKKDAKANVKDNLGDSEKAPKKPKGVEEFKDKGVTGSFKTIKEGIEEIIREKLAQKKANEATDFSNHYDFEYRKIDGDCYKIDPETKEKSKVHHSYCKRTQNEAKVEEGEFKFRPTETDAPGYQARPDGYLKEAGSVSQDKKEKARAALSIHLKSAKEEGDKEAEKEVLDARDKIMKASSLKDIVNILDDFGYDAGEIKGILGKVNEHHNDPNFPTVKGLYDLLDAIVADWGKEDLYHEVEDIIVAYIEPDATTMSKEAIKKIKDVLENYDVLEDYAELVNGIAVKEPGTGIRPGVNLGASFDKFKSSLKEKLKADVKVKQVKEKKDNPLDEGALDNQIASLEKVVAQKKKETADAEKKVADMKAKEASAEAQG